MMDKNPYIMLFKTALAKDYDFSDSRVYIIKRFEFLAGYLRFFESNYEKDNFSEVLRKLKYNPQSNNVIVFYVENDVKGGEVYLVTDTLNFHGSEFIIKKYNHIFNRKLVDEAFVKIAS